MAAPDSSAAKTLGLRGLWYACGAGLLVVVAVLSLLPVPDVGVGDKLSHLLTYAVLGGWFGLLVTRPAGLGLVFAGLLAYGALIELLQGMTGYRYAEWGDLLANAIGLLLGLPLYFTPLRRLLYEVDRLLLRLGRR